MSWGGAAGLERDFLSLSGGRRPGAVAATFYGESAPTAYETHLPFDCI